MPEDLNQWREPLLLATPLLRILAIWLLAGTAVVAIRRLIALKLRLVGPAASGRQRARLATVFNVIRHTATAVVIAVAVVTTFGQLGISIAPLLTAAGIAGVAIGFGAQSLVKDFFTGVCLLLEDQITEGDAIEVAGKTGVVERVTLRHIRLRDYDGAVHYIPNSIVTAVTNRSRGFAYAVIDVTVPRALEPARVFERMRQVGEAMYGDPALDGAVLEPIDIAGVEKLDDTTQVLRCRIKTAPSRQWRVRREFLRRLRPLLDEERRALEAERARAAAEQPPGSEQATVAAARP